MIAIDELDNKDDTRTRRSQSRFSTDELRRWGLISLWSIVGWLFWLWFLLDWLWPPAESIKAWIWLLGLRVLLGLCLWAGAALLYLVEPRDLWSLIIEWSIWLALSLYLGIAGVWLAPISGPFVAVLVGLLIVARGVFLPGGVRCFLPPVLLLWGLATLAWFSFAQRATQDLHWYRGQFLTQWGLILAVLIGAWAAWRFEHYRRQLGQTDRLGRYRILRRLQTKGISQIELSWHLLLERPCVLKRIPIWAVQREQSLLDFRREVELVIWLQNPHVVRVFDFGETEREFYLAMEYLPGVNLHQLLYIQGPLVQRRAVHLMRQICDGVAAIHEQGILHRDLKPSNLFLTVSRQRCDFIKIIDFGIAKRRTIRDLNVMQQIIEDDIAEPSSTIALNHAEGHDRRESEADEQICEKIPGTPAYMAPERFDGRDDIGADIYSLGIVFYRLLSGQLPFRASSAAEYRRLHREAELPLAPLYAACPDLLPQLLDVMRCATAKKPAERYPSADAMKQALDLCQEALGEWRQEEAKRAWDLLQDVIQQDPAGLCASPDIDKAAQDTSSASETSASTQAKAPEDSHITTEQDYEQRSDCGIGEYIDTNKTQALATKIAPQIPSLILPDFEELEFMPNSEVSHKEPKT